MDVHSSGKVAPAWAISSGMCLPYMPNSSMATPMMTKTLPTTRRASSTPMSTPIMAIQRSRSVSMPVR